MKRSRYQIQSEVRRIFVRHWLDPDALTLTLGPQSVRVSGVLRGTGQDGSAGIDASLFEVLEAEIRRVPEIHRVQFDFRNWRRDAGGMWREERPAKPPRRRGAGTESRPGTGAALPEPLGQPPGAGAREPAEPGDAAGAQG